MDLCSISDIHDLLSGQGFKFSKAMGQNFLIAPWVPDRISAESGVGKENCVLEIGPGVGCLTEKLSDAAGKVVAVELDKRLLPVLAVSLAGCGNIEVINGDIMKLDLGELVREHFSGLVPAVCANLPYNITSPVLTKLIGSGLFPAMTVMIQKEVAQRICAKAATPEYGAFSVYVQYYTEPKLLFDVPPSCFEPRPKVTSSVIKLTLRDKPPVECDEKLFFRVVRAAFNQRRKTLANALSSGFSEIPKDKIAAAVTAAGLDVSVRGEALDMFRFADVSNALERLMQ